MYRFYLRAVMGVVGLHYPPLGGIDCIKSKGLPDKCPVVSPRQSCAPQNLPMCQLKPSKYQVHSTRESEQHATGLFLSPGNGLAMYGLSHCRGKMQHQSHDRAHLFIVLDILCADLHNVCLPHSGLGCGVADVYMGICN